MDIEITRSEAGRKGRYIARIAGCDETGELTYSRLDDDAVIADHTGVPHTLRKHGIATALVRRLVADARRDKFRIVPRCSFVKAQFDRHPEWSDLYQPTLGHR